MSEYGGSAVLWQIDLLGQPCGAWVLPVDGAENARTVLSICDRRALIAVNITEPVDHLITWSSEAGVVLDRDSLDARVCSIPVLLEETIKARDSHTTFLQDLAQRERKKLVALTWKTSIPATRNDTLESLIQAASIGIGTGPQETQRAWLMARLAQWALDRWIETETARTARRYLREAFGSSEPLPPSWRKAVIAAYRSPFPLPEGPA